jgi:hypothetical protein
MKHTTIFKKMFAAFSAAAVAASCVSLTAFAEGEMYTWEAGEYWVEPGGELAISPTVYNCPGDLMTIGFDFDEAPLFGTGAVILSEYGNEDGILGTAYPSFTNMAFHVSKLHAGGTDKENGELGVAAAADGSQIATMYMNIADEETVKAAAESLGLKLQEDAEHGTYYAFPLNFDYSVDPVKESPKCEAVNIKEEYTEINYVDGHVNIMVEGVVESDPYTVYLSMQSGADQYWAADDEGVTPVSFSEDGTYTVSVESLTGSDSIELLLLSTNINLFAFVPEDYEFVDNATLVADSGINITIDSIQLTHCTYDENGALIDGETVDIAYTDCGADSLNIENDGVSLRKNIYNVWQSPNVSDIASAGYAMNAGDYITVTFTVTGLGDSPFSEVNYGDVDADGSIAIADATMILTEYAGTAAGLEATFDDAMFAAGDVDGDGSIAIADATAILGYYAANAAGLNPDMGEYFPASVK